MISQSSYATILLMIAIGTAIPLGLSIWWIRTRKEKMGTILIGAATWFVFAVILESIPKAFLFNPSNPIGRAVTGSAFLYVLAGALLAGLFEETGRLIAFRAVLKNRTNKETSVSHGIGHGGFEAFFMLVVTGVQYLVYASMINAGRFQDLIDAAAAKGADVSAIETLPEAIMSLTPSSVCIAGLERVFAIMLHIGLSVLVFYAVKRSKIGLYFLAVLLHMLFDVPAALYQVGIIKNVYFVEVLIGVYAVIFFVTVIKKLYKKDVPSESGEGVN